MVFMSNDAFSMVTDAFTLREIRPAVCPSISETQVSMKLITNLCCRQVEWRRPQPVGKSAAPTLGEELHGNT